MRPPEALPPARRSLLGLALAVVAHLVLLWGLWRATALHWVSPAPAAVALQWIRLVPEAPTRRATPPPRLAPLNSPPRPLPADARLTAPVPAHPVSEGQWVAGPVAAEPASAPASAPRERLLDNLATRQAIRSAARGPLLSERAAQATDTPVSRTDTALASQVHDAGRGDCLKGEYLGGGAGLLSVPFLAYAAVAGKCAR